jgi:hypothetical protein
VEKERVERASAVLSKAAQLAVENCFLTFRCGGTSRQSRSNPLNS